MNIGYYWYHLKRVFSGKEPLTSCNERVFQEYNVITSYNENSTFHVKKTKSSPNAGMYQTRRNIDNFFCRFLTFGRFLFFYFLAFAFFPT
jgi:hypothetical protein